MATDDERRRDFRTEPVADEWLIWREHGGMAVTPVAVCNISQTGLKVRIEPRFGADLADHFPVGGEVDLLDMPLNGSPTAKIRWQKRDESGEVEVGLEFATPLERYDRVLSQFAA